MKSSLNLLLLLLSTFIFLFSCSTESIGMPEESSEDIPEVIPDMVPEAVNVENCADGFFNVEAGETLTIDCILDLDGEPIDLPNDVTLISENGGDIINGTLNFGSGGKIDGSLMNASLQLTGDVKLNNTVFQFIPSRWGIVEGKVDNTVARANRDLLQESMQNIKNLGGNEFRIDTMDAFFNVDESELNTLPSLAAITLPSSDFTLKMTNDTHLRMQPNAARRPTLLATFRASNVTIDGGVLHGDRDEHDYSDGGTHEWGHTLRISGSDNIVVKNMTFIDATGDGIDVHGDGHSFDPHYKTSENLLITNNTFIRSRRNQISITDGRDIIVEGNEFIDASIHTSKSTGVAPGFAIDVEAVRGTNPAGLSEIAEDITIRGNTESGGRLGAVTVHTGDRVTIEENDFENFISYSTSIGTIIRNNVITAKTPKNTDNGIAIVAGRNDRYDRNFGGRVYGNTITDYSIGIVPTNKDIEVYDNTILNAKIGISIETIRDAKIYGNTIKSTRSGSDGIVSHPTVEYMDNVIIGSNTGKNEIDVERTPLKFTNINIAAGQETYKLVIDNNLIKSKNTSTINNSYGIEFVNNTITEGGIRLIDVSNITMMTNTITSTSTHGIRLDKGCKNMSISSHEINVGTGFECITQTTTDGVNIEITDLNCNR